MRLPAYWGEGGRGRGKGKGGKKPGQNRASSFSPCFDVIIHDLMRMHCFFAAILSQMDLCNVDAREAYALCD